MTVFDLAREPTSAHPMKYSICTLVTRADEYAEMVNSFVAKGFTPKDTEFVAIDNSSRNVADGYEGYNRFLNDARGEHIILCHQDVLLIDDGREELDRALAALYTHDPNWAVCGNAGGINLSSLAIRITDPHGEDQRIGRLPQRVSALDENFIIVRRDANLSVSRDLSGFHLYAADLCILADILGWSVYVIDFHLKHKSAGNADEDFQEGRRALIQKYRRAFRPRWVVTPSTHFFIHSGSAMAGVRRRTISAWRRVRGLADRVGRKMRAASGSGIRRR